MAGHSCLQMVCGMSRMSADESASNSKSTIALLPLIKVRFNGTGMDLVRPLERYTRDTVSVARVIVVPEREELGPDLSLKCDLIHLDLPLTVLETQVTRLQGQFSNVFFSLPNCTACIEHHSKTLPFGLVHICT